jgi:glucose-1-phosphate cytidylyltransferase
MLTYGDGLSDIDLNRLLNFHKNHGKLVTVSAVRPSARFGELDIDKNGIVSSFKEKPQTEQGWINGGFFIIEPRFFEYIENDNTVLENEPLTRVANEGELVSFKHEGFWQCMDTKRDRDYLENLEKNERPPWKK